MAQKDMAQRMRVSAGRIGLMLTAFLMLGLIGVFATYAAPIPAMRGMLAESALARAIAANNPAQIQHAMQQAKPMLGIKAQKTFATLPATRQGALTTTRLLATETTLASALISYRLRLEIIVIGFVAAFFGIALLGINDAAPTTAHLGTHQGSDQP